MRIGVWILCFSLVFAFGCKKSSQSGNEVTQTEPAPGMVKGLAATPREARVLVGINVARAAESPLLQIGVGLMLQSAPQFAKALRAAITNCGFQWQSDVDSVVAAMGDPEKRTEIVLIASGRFKGEALIACAGQASQEAGATMTQRDLNGAEVYEIKRDDSSVWLGFGSPNTLIVAGSKEWYFDARSPKDRSELQIDEYLRKIDVGRPLWGVLMMDEAGGQSLVQATEGILTQPPEAVYGDFLDAEELALRLHFDLKNPQDAKAMVSYLENQMESWTLIAQSGGLGEAIANLNFKAEENTVHAVLELRGLEKRQLVDRLKPQQQQQGEPQ